MKKASVKKSQNLQQGDIIDIIAPSSACTPEELDHAVQWLTSQGYNPRVPQNLLEPIDFLANTDKKRFEVLKKALTAKDSKVVWCLRGGYGALRLIPQLLKLKKTQPKLLIGMSDITILHQFLSQKWGWSSVHGPVLSRTSKENKRASDYDELFGLLSGQKDSIEFRNLKPLNSAAKKNKKKIVSKVIGGNLCTFVSMLGTGLQPKVNGKFLFFEDIAERGYKVDRMLNQLGQAGLFKNCKGVFFGDFIKSEEANGKNLVWPAIEAYFKDARFPVYAGIESDHSEKQRPLYLNTTAILNNENGAILKVYSN